MHRTQHGARAHGETGVAERLLSLDFERAGHRGLVHVCEACDTVAPSAEMAHRVSAAVPTVLVVDHDPAARAMIAQTLHLLGHTSVAAAEGAETLTLARRHAESLALLIVEVATPGLTDGGLARAVGLLRPRVPVLFVSGERARRDLADTVVGRPASLLVKPFSAEELRLAVGELTT